MPQVVYPWKRFWYPRGGQISLADAGFLVDPESEYARYHSQDVRSFDAIAPSSCMVLLGEPGIGKSTALKAEFEATKASAEAVGDMAMSFDLRDYSSEERLERKVFKCDAVRSWLRGKNTLHLFLDSLDEGLLRIDNISRVILSELDELPASRLRLRIASRPADWPGSLEEGFQHFWGKENVFVFALAPLRRKDALCAARVAGLDAEAFVTDLIRAEVVPLAIKPVTLELLMATFAENKSLPARRAGLYSQGCRRLCEAPSPHRTESPNVRGRLSPGQRMAIAGRLAALSQFSNRSAFWTGPESGIEPQDIALEAVIGGSEGRNETEATVDMIGVREALDTGLFSPVALNRHGWRHQSYSEYLAAFHLHENKVPLDRLRTLFLHPDGSNRVIPQLRETATWLTSLDPDFFRMITRFDPEVVLRSDMTAASPADRADLARQLLRYFEAGGRLQSLWDLRWPFTRLENPELPTILRPYLSDKTRAKECRIAAIEIVGACKLRSLEPELVAIFSDVTEQESVRKRAIAVVGEVGSRNARAALRPIVFNEGDDDPHDELRGYALEQLWPELLSASELFDHLRPPRGPEVSASYQRFIQSGIAVSLKGTDIIRALVWANQHSAGHDKSNALNRLAAEILERAIDYIEESGVAEVLAGVVMERVRKFSDCEGLTMKLRDSSDKVRYCFAHAFIQKATGYTHGAFALIDLCSVGAPDLPWLLKEFELAGDDGTRILLAEVIARCLGNASVIDFDTVLSTASRDATLNTAIGSQINAIELNSPLALRIKADYAQWASLRRPNPLPSELPFDQALLEALSDAGPTAYFQIHLLFHQRKKNLNHPTDPLPGWSDLSPAIRSSVLLAAREYLTTRPPAPPGSWWEKGHFSFGMVAGSSALHLLAEESPGSLDALSDEDWEFWTPMVVAHRDGQPSARNLVLAKAYDRAPNIFIATLEGVIDGENERIGQLTVLRDLGTLWSDELAAALREKIAGLKPKAFKNAIEILLDKADLKTREFARAMATGHVPATGEERSRIVYAAVELLSHNPDEWKMLWPIFRNDEAFCVEVLETTAYENEFNSFAMQLDAREVADLCIWLAGRGLEKTRPDPKDLGLITPSVALARWWNVLINSLTLRGTPDSCAALEELVAALPKYQDGLQNSLRRAQELTRRMSWDPPSLGDVLNIARYDKTLRLVISVHGIRTRGAWQKEVNSDLQKAGFRHELLDYGYFWAFQLVIPWMRKKKVEWFRSEYEKSVAGTNARPSIISHSFGTYIIAEALVRYPEITLDRLILCGSIVRRDFDWRRLLDGGQVNAVLNEYGGRDIWAKLVQWFVADTGPSGTKGFTSSDSSLYQRYRPHFGHSDYFFPLNYQTNWIPFLRGHEPEANAVEEGATPK